MNWNRKKDETVIPGNDSGQRKKLTGKSGRTGENSWNTLPYILLIIVLAAATVTSLLFYQYQTGSFLRQTEEASTTYERHYAFVGDKSSSFLQSVYEAAYAKGVENGDYIEFTGYDLESSYATDTLMKIAVASGVDGIIVNADNNNDLVEEINDATEAGIPVVCIGTENYGSDRKSFIGLSNYSLGQEYGRLITEQVKDGTQDVLILKSADERVSSQNLVVSGMVDYVTKQNMTDHFSITSQTAGDDTMFSAAESVTDIFSEEELPDILICLDETTTTAACQAVVDSNHVGDIVILGFYMNDTILNSLEKDVLEATITVSPELFGESAVECLDTYLADGFVTEYVSIDFTTVTADNVGDYIAENSLAGASEDGGDADE